MSAPTYECECGYAIFSTCADWEQDDLDIEAHRAGHERDDARPVEHVGDPLPKTQPVSPWPAIGEPHPAPIEDRAEAIARLPFDQFIQLGKDATEQRDAFARILAEACIEGADVEPFKSGYAAARDEYRAYRRALEIVFGGQR